MAHGPVAGLLLAAGGGRRFGKPKALVTSGGEAWVTRGCRVLSEAGCAPLMVVLGAAADQAAPLVPSQAQVVVNADWETGMGSSLRAGLRQCLQLSPQVQAVVVMLVDLPGINADVVGKFVTPTDTTPTETTQTGASLSGVLRQATFQGVIGHPVLLGRNHWAAICEASGGDIGARSYLGKHGAVLVELGHLADGSDQDTP